MKIKIKSKALATVLGYKQNDIIDIECRQGVPVSKEWRNRIKDSVIDDCVEIVKLKKGAK